MKLGHILLAALLTLGIAAPVFSKEDPKRVETVEPGEFVKKRYTIHGNWSVQGDTISFDESFKTKGGPDLKVFLSPKTISNVTGHTALDGALYLGVLKSNKGQQSYKIPAEIDLSQYESLLIQCEAFSVLWGGFDLPDSAS